MIKTTRQDTASVHALALPDALALPAQHKRANVDAKGQSKSTAKRSRQQDKTKLLQMRLNDQGRDITTIDECLDLPDALALPAQHKQINTCANATEQRTTTR